MLADTPPTQPPDDSTRTYDVLLWRRNDVQRALEALTKRARRKSLVPVSWTWGKAFARKETRPHPQFGWEVHHEETVERIPLVLVGETPKYAGWSFAATLQHLGGENIVRALAGRVMPELYRTRGPMCDHCRSMRRRNDTFVLQHDDGRFIQVGSTCLKDFLGSDDADRLAASASYLSDVMGICDDGTLGGGGGGASRDRLLVDVLAVTSAMVRDRGWLSRTKARETDGVSTADYVWIQMTDPPKNSHVEVTDQDKVDGETAADWAEAISDEEIGREAGDYLHNIRAIARSGIVDHRLVGLGASILVGWQRAVGRAREKASKPYLHEHVGTIGDKITLGLPPKVGKRGQPLKGSPTVVDLRPVTLDFVTDYETEFGLVTILVFRSIDGVLLKWKASNPGGVGRDDVGKLFAISGSVKKHEEYTGKDGVTRKQTILTRCTIEEVVPIPATLIETLEDKEEVSG